MKTGVSLVMVTVLLAVACRKSEMASRRLVPVEREQAVALAKQTATEAFGRLSGELAAAIAEGGVTSAVPVCSERAPVILAEIASEKHVGVSRRTDQPRNRNQVAGETDRQVMAAFREAMAAGQPLEPDVREGADSEVEVRLPIVLDNPLCLKCHGTGEDVVAETREAIRSIYPGDQAIGYQLNDLRGIWKITIPAQRKP